VIDGTAYDVATVVWATGFRQVFDWIKVPILGQEGWQVEYRGVVKDSPGLFFCGLSFQYCCFALATPFGILLHCLVANASAARKTGEHRWSSHPSWVGRSAACR
jgi:putative flavoprotein involved in K+ transport